MHDDMAAQSLRRTCRLDICSVIVDWWSLSQRSQSKFFRILGRPCSNSIPIESFRMKTRPTYSAIQLGLLSCTRSLHGSDLSLLKNFRLERATAIDAIIVSMELGPAHLAICRLDLSFDALCRTNSLDAKRRTVAHEKANALL